MSVIDSSDLWSTASAEVESEHRERQVTAALSAAEDVVTSMVRAVSHSDFENRVALYGDQLDGVCARLATDPVGFASLRSAVGARIEASFNQHLEARQRIQQAENARRAAVRADIRRIEAAGQAGLPGIGMPDPGWGEHYGGGGPSYITPDGPVWMFRKGQKVRFYDASGNQVGPEQSNVAPAVAYALDQGWDSGIDIQWTASKTAAAGDRITQVRKIVDSGSVFDDKGKPWKLEGSVCDLNTARLLAQAYEALSPENQARFDDVPLGRLVDMVWSKARFSRKQAARDFGEGLVGKQMLGMPGSEILGVEPTADYLMNGPVGDGWYEPSEDRYVTTDFLVKVRLGDGRVVEFPKSYRWVTENAKRPERVTQWFSSKTAGKHEWQEGGWTEDKRLIYECAHCGARETSDNRHHGVDCPATEHTASTRTYDDYARSMREDGMTPMAKDQWERVKDEDEKESERWRSQVHPSHASKTAKWYGLSYVEGEGYEAGKLLGEFDDTAAAEAAGADIILNGSTYTRKGDVLTDGQGKRVRIISAYDYDYDDVHEDVALCPVCQGPSELLGGMGAKVWYRCRNCGMEHHHPAEVHAASKVASVKDGCPVCGAEWQYEDSEGFPVANWSPSIVAMMTHANDCPSEEAMSELYEDGSSSLDDRLPGYTSSRQAALDPDDDYGWTGSPGLSWNYSQYVESLTGGESPRRFPQEALERGPNAVRLLWEEYQLPGNSDRSMADTWERMKKEMEPRFLDTASRRIAYRDDPHWIDQTRYDSSCSVCGAPLRRGSRAWYWPKSKKMECDRCGAESEARFKFDVGEEEGFPAYGSHQAAGESGSLGVGYDHVKMREVPVSSLKPGDRLFQGGVGMARMVGNDGEVRYNLMGWTDLERQGGVIRTVKSVDDGKITWEQNGKSYTEDITGKEDRKVVKIEASRSKTAADRPPHREWREVEVAFTVLTGTGMSSVAEGIARDVIYGAGDGRVDTALQLALQADRHTGFSLMDRMLAHDQAIQRLGSRRTAGDSIFPSKEDGQEVPLDEDGGAREPEEEETDPNASALDPGQMKPGQALAVTYTLTGEASGQGEATATFESFDGTTAYFTYDKGRFAVTQQNGKWADAAGTQFDFAIAGEPAEDPPEQAPIDEGNEPEKAEDPKDKKKNPFAKGGAWDVGDPVLFRYQPGDAVTVKNWNGAESTGKVVADPAPGMPNDAFVMVAFDSPSLGKYETPVNRRDIKHAGSEEYYLGHRVEANPYLPQNNPYAQGRPPMDDPEGNEFQTLVDPVTTENRHPETTKPRGRGQNQGQDPVVQGFAGRRRR